MNFRTNRLGAGILVTESEAPNVAPRLERLDFTITSGRNLRQLEYLEPERGLLSCTPYSSALQRGELGWKKLTLHEKILVNAVAAAYYPERFLGAAPNNFVNQMTNYHEGARQLQVTDMQDDELQDLTAAYRRNPLLALATMHANLVNLCREAECGHTFGSPAQLEQFLKQRLTRYYDASAAIEIMFDAAAFPPTTDLAAPAKSGVLRFIPDGYSDMGKNPQINPLDRSREKIRVDKATDLAMLRGALCGIIWRAAHRTSWLGQPLPHDAGEVQLQMVDQLARWVHQSVRYNTTAAPLLDINRSVPMASFLKAGEGVCRHHALMGQLMMQHLGLRSLLYKCYLNGGSHAANLVRLKDRWHALDITNPKDGQVYLHQLPGSDDPGPRLKKASFRIGDRIYMQARDSYHRVLPRL